MVRSSCVNLVTFVLSGTVWVSRSDCKCLLVHSVCVLVRTCVRVCVCVCNLKLWHTFLWRNISYIS